MSVLQPDTTAAQVTSVTPLDSVTVLIEFDDYVDPEFPLAGVVVAVADEDSVSVAATRLFHEHEYVTYIEDVADSIAVLDSLGGVAREAERAVRDSIAAVGDSLTAGQDSTAAEPALAP
ncbi:MAG TPA: hypothetical protein EYQ27_02590, partial [Gemmatimonadetes bacterium]|nr:hypothetical protein [Gemmatimonadota bacterium]